MTVRGRALIVDDNVALARVTQFALERAGFETRTGATGAKLMSWRKRSRSISSSRTSKCPR